MYIDELQAKVCNDELEAQAVYIDELVSEEVCRQTNICVGVIALIDRGILFLWARGNSPYGPGGIPLMDQEDSPYGPGGFPL